MLAVVRRSREEVDQQEPPGPEGLSQFISKVLDQLSISAWLPSAMLVGAGAILLQLRNQDNLNLGSALISLTGKPLGVLVVLPFLLVLAAMVSQACSYAAIRVLEGYWVGPLFTIGFYDLLVRWHSRHRTTLEARLDAQNRAAFQEAQDAMRGTRMDQRVIDRLKGDIYGQYEDDATWPADVIAQAERYDWQAHCSAGRLGAIGRTFARLSEYPAPHRVLPTRLGNTMRATEDTLRLNGGDLEGYIMRNRESMSSRLQLLHDQYRTRLDLYCTLVFVYAALALVAGILLAPNDDGPLGTIVAIAIFAALAIASYYSAIASAKGYCSVLRAVDREMVE